jgi:hypothetical protein
MAKTMSRSRREKDPGEPLPTGKAGGLRRRATRNTKRGMAGGTARSTRGRKRVIERSERGESRAGARR